MDERLRELIDLIFVRHYEDHGVSCQTCQDELHTLWDMVKSGAELRDILPAVSFHLECCPECMEEYQAFMCIMRADEQGVLETISLEMRPDSNRSTVHEEK